MKTIIKYIANDGDEFTHEDDCLIHEERVEAGRKIIAGLPSVPKEDGWSCGELGYIQHDKNFLLSVRNSLLELFKFYTDHKWIQETIDKGFDAHSSFVGRIISECAPSSISKLWYRFQCIDSDFREWGQPYYANNPSEAKQVKIN